jgi:hypothetical protein
MKKLLPVALLIGCGHGLFGQNVGIGTQAPASSALLDLSASDKGVLIPRVSLTNVLQTAPVTNPTEGLLVYNTNAVVGGTGGVGKGFYFWAGSRWQRFGNTGDAWNIIGNPAIDTSIHFIGSTGGGNNQALRFRVSNQWAGSIEYSNENLYLGMLAGARTQRLFLDVLPVYRNTFIGAEAGRYNETGFSNTYLGAYAGRLNVTGIKNTVVGALAGSTDTAGNFNTYIGMEAGGREGWGQDNTAVGSEAGAFLSPDGASNGNSYLGMQAGILSLNSSGNVAVGRRAGRGGVHPTYGLGNYNVFIGDSSGLTSLNSHSNVVIGRMAARSITNGSRNVMIGDSAGYNNTQGDNNVYIGSVARGSSASLINAAAIGNRAYVTTSNSLVLGSVAGENGASSGVKVGIGVSGPAYRLHIVSDDPANAGHLQGIMLENNQESTGEAAINFRNRGTDGTGNNYWMAGLNQNRNFAFAYGNDFNLATTRMVLDSTGRLGIGVAAPTEKLEVSGNLRLSGELYKGTGTANMLPVCYGNITSSAGIQASTGNITSVVKSGTGIYDIVIAGNPYTLNEFVAQVTPSGPDARMVSTSASGGTLRIRFFDAAGVAVDTGFHFVVYKP